MIGAAIGKFRFEKQLGRGGFGEMWLAEHEDTIPNAADQQHHRVAIKLFHPDVSANHVALQQAIEEARALSRIAATGIAKIYDAGWLQSGQAYMIRDYVEGEPLALRIASSRHSSTQLADVIEQTANALVTAANAGVIHNNVKPSNIFIIKNPDRPSGEQVVIVDFAHGRLVSAMPDKGTVGYMAPEQVQGIKADWRIDAYSLGCIAFELGCQRAVFIATSWDAMRSKHQKDKPPNLRSFVPDASAALDRLVARMLEKNPAERPKSMKDISKLFQLMVGYEAPLGETVKD